MRVRHLTARDFSRQPWRNAGGYTTELALQAEGERWTWRLSVADVTSSGPFSDFTGYRRTLMLLEGAGMELAFEGRPPVRIDRPHVPIDFDGAWKTECRLLAGPVSDLNLIFDPARVRGEMGVITIEDDAEVELAPTSLLHGLAGACWIEAEGTHRLAAGELLRIDDAPGEPLRLHALPGGCRVAHVALRPVAN